MQGLPEIKGGHLPVVRWGSLSRTIRFDTIGETLVHSVRFPFGRKARPEARFPRSASRNDAVARFTSGRLHSGHTQQVEWPASSETEERSTSARPALHPPVHRFKTAERRSFDPWCPYEPTGNRWPRNDSQFDLPPLPRPINRTHPTLQSLHPKTAFLPREALSFHGSLQWVSGMPVTSIHLVLTRSKHRQSSPPSTHEIS